MQRFALQTKWLEENYVDASCNVVQNHRSSMMVWKGAKCENGEGWRCHPDQQRGNFGLFSTWNLIQHIKYFWSYIWNILIFPDLSLPLRQQHFFLLPYRTFFRFHWFSSLIFQNWSITGRNVPISGSLDFSCTESTACRRSPTLGPRNSSECLGSNLVSWRTPLQQASSI